MNRLLNWLNGAAIGGGLMYFADPVLGARRRSLLRDQVIHALKKSTRAADTTRLDVQNRLYGTLAELRGCFTPHDVSDDVVVDRVRSKMGRHVSHPSAIEVKARDGCVTLRGPVLAHEVEPLLTALRRVLGVYEIDNQLDVHETSENIAALQGGVPRTGEPYEWMQSNWAPATRVLAGTAGFVLVANCLSKRTPAAALGGTAGFALFLRALTNLEMSRLLGIGGGRRGIYIQKSIIIHRPVDEVFDVLSEPSLYPHFSDLIVSVRELGNGRYQKTIAGPAGAKLTLHETITRRVPNEFVACRSEPNSPLQYAGRARFTPLDGSRTKVDIHATYNPPGGILSHSAAWVAGLDPKSQLDEMLMRAKSYLESRPQPLDPIDEASMESFPASDAPSYSRSSTARR